MIDICMVTWYRPEITERTIRTIKSNTTTPYRLIVVDNDSPFEMVEMLRGLFEEGLINRLIELDSNLGLEPARNIGLKEVTSDLFVCADNDCLPMRPDEQGDWLGKLIKLMDDHPDYGAISARTQVMIGTGNIFEEADKNGEDLVQFPHPGGSLRIMRTSLVREVGGWRDDEAGRGAEERYIGEKINSAGHKTGFATHVNCLHLFGDEFTDRWGYPFDWTPELTGHSDIWHPVLERGDDPDEVQKYTSD